MGFAVLAIDYRGFGRSDGDLPSEAQAYADAQAAWAELRRREPRADALSSTATRSAARSPSTSPSEPTMPPGSSSSRGSRRSPMSWLGTTGR